MAWCKTGDKPLSEPMVTYVIDANMRHLASMSDYIKCVSCAIITFTCNKWVSIILGCITWDNLVHTRATLNRFILMSYHFIFRNMITLHSYAFSRQINPMCIHSRGIRDLSNYVLFQINGSIRWKMFRYFRSLSSPYMAEATNHTDVCWHVKSPNMCRKGWGLHVDLKALTSCDTLDDMSTCFFYLGI